MNRNPIKPLAEAFEILTNHQDIDGVRKALTFIDQSIKIIEETMWDNTKEFECFWGYGYVKPEQKSRIEYHKLDFFMPKNGYEFDDFKEINNLKVGDSCNLAQASNEHWIRRMK